MPIYRNLPVVETGIKHITPAQVKMVNLYETIMKIYLERIEEIMTILPMPGKFILTENRWSDDKNLISAMPDLQCTNYCRDFAL